MARSLHVRRTLSDAIMPPRLGSVAQWEDKAFAEALHKLVTSSILQLTSDGAPGK